MLMRWLILTSLFQGTPASDSLFTITPAAIEIYAIAIRDLGADLAQGAVPSQVQIALDPWIRREPKTLFPTWPWPGTRLSEPSLTSLTRAAGIRRVCEPAGRDACRGTVRGLVVHLAAVQFHSTDSARVVTLLTSARSEYDNTALGLRGRYYIYDVVREPAGWAIRQAHRGLDTWRTT